MREFLARLRELKESTGTSCRVLEKLIPYGKSTIHDKLAGKSNLAWDFVSDFVTACAQLVGQDPNLSMWRAAFDQLNLALDLENYRHLYLGGEDTVASPLYPTWKRSGRRDHIAAHIIDDLDLDVPLIKYGQVVVDYLMDRWHGQPAYAILATPEAVVCTRRGTDHELEKRLDDNYLIPGSCYAEKYIATNGIGTAMATRDTAYVLGAGHLAEELQDDACAAAVIPDPWTNEVVGIINLTCRLKDASPHLVTLAEMTAAAISSSLSEDRRDHAR